ncbi:Protein of uncharacterised function (DUF1800) [Mycobacteroides abscessus subsp. abscessus]|nr:Protein of uncharacterised function (DUF1800) [Mycobacteroides abscessus subsp. abscessus]
MAAQSERWIATARLLRRSGFGTTGSIIDSIMNQDPANYVDAVLNSDAESDAATHAIPMPVFSDATRFPVNGPQSAKDAWNKRADEEMLVLSRWWLDRMLTVREPAHEKLTFLWHNHFATSAAKVRRAVYMGAQNQKLRTLKLGSFRDLAMAMLTDAAMLTWLDGTDNVASSPNENLAREFMELFALGHGNGYTEADVKEGARALTGWTVGPRGQATVRLDKHDDNIKTVLGVTGNLDAAAFCDAVLAYPSSSSYVVGRLWRGLASSTPPSAQTEQRLLGAYGPSQDLKALTKAILVDPEFGKQTSVITPVEWFVGVLRTLGMTLENDRVAYVALDLLRSLGQQPFYPPDVSGWPSGRVWVSTGSVSSQAWAAGELAKRGNISPIESASVTDRIDAVGYFIGVGSWSDRTVKALKNFVNDPRALFTAAVSTPEYLTV